MLAHAFLERRLRQDRNPVGVQRARKLDRIAPAVDVRDLRRGERDHVVLGPVPVDEVEVVEVAARGTRDQDSSSSHA